MCKKSIGRIGAAVATGGLSEVAKPAVKAASRAAKPFIKATTRALNPSGLINTLAKGVGTVAAALNPPLVDANTPTTSVNPQPQQPVIISGGGFDTSTILILVGGVLVAVVLFKKL